MAKAPGRRRRQDRALERGRRAIRGLPLAGSALSFLGCLALAAAGQAPPTPAFPSAAELVKVDVVVLDQAGEPVRGLAAADFSLTDDGETRQISLFEAVDEGDDPAAPARLTGEAPPARPAPPRGLREIELVVAFDELHLSPAGLEQARRRLAETLEADTLGPAVLTLLSTAGGGAWRGHLPEERETLVAALSRFESRGRAREVGRLSDQEAFQIAARHDDRVLTEAYRRYLDQRLLPDPTLVGAMPRMRGQQTEAQQGLPAIGRSAVQVEAEMVWREVRGRQATTLRALCDLLGALASRPGRKAVLLLSEGFLYDPSLTEHRELLALARRAQAGVHVIDPRSANRLFWHEGEASDWVDTRDYAAALDRALKDAEGAETVAAGTGGQVLRQLPALPRALARLTRELRTYYLLGYVPPGLLEDGHYHALQVRVRQPGLRVHARPGYYALPARPAAGRGATPAALESLLVAPAGSGTWPLQLAAFVLGPAAKGQTLVRLLAEVDEAAVGPAGAGAAEGLLQLVPLGRQPTRRWAGRATRTAGRLRMEAQFTLPPGAYQAQAALSSGDGLASGSAQRAVEVLPREALRLSTPILTDRLEGSTPVMRAGRTFAAAGNLHCLVEVLGSAIVGPVRAGVQLVDAGGRVWRESRAAPITTSRRSRMWSLPLSGLPPGPYTLLISALDEGSREGLQQREELEIVSAP